LTSQSFPFTPEGNRDIDKAMIQIGGEIPRETAQEGISICYCKNLNTVFEGFSIIKHTCRNANKS
jgi:hypothetical protein